MKFGSVKHPEKLDLELPVDHPGTKKLLNRYKKEDLPQVYVGCAKWTSSDLKGFYPDGVQDELSYYAQEFNAVELNATHYRNFPEEQIRQWSDRVPDNFKFFPKVNRYISHLKWLNDIDEPVDRYLGSVLHFENNLGTSFLQLRDKFAPKFFDRVEKFLEIWPDDVPLAMEFRHPDWFLDQQVAEDLFQLLELKGIANVISDTAGHRELLHMRLTNGEAFIRFVGANASSDYDRLNEWVKRLTQWQDQGIQKIHFFVHQNEEKASPNLARYFIKKLNKALGSNLKVPNVENPKELPY